MKELGVYLRDVRRNNGVGIEEASDDLNISSAILENIECGNTRAFRDMLELKEIVKKYAKYLGLDPEKVEDEFNDFLFEHTSRISLSDILEAEAQQTAKKEEKEVFSPYTKPSKIIKPPKNANLFGLILIGALLLIAIVLIVIIIVIPKKTVVNRELKDLVYRSDVYERT